MNLTEGDLEVLRAAAKGEVTRVRAGARWRTPDGHCVDHRVRSLYMRHLIWINSTGGAGHRVELTARGIEELNAHPAVNQPG